MDKKQFDTLLKEIKIMKKLLIAGLYSSDVPDEDLSKITGMDAGDIRKLVSKRKMKGGKNAKKKEES
jgi:hypothetical protein